MSQLRVLCLHGRESRGEILQWQLQALGRKLADDHSMSLVCIDGLLETEPDHSMTAIFDGPFYEWVHSTGDTTSFLSTTRNAFEYLDQVVADEGPFDGILGYSQGGSLACGYLMRLQERGGTCHPFRFAMFVVSGDVTDEYLALRDAPGLDARAREGTVARQTLDIPSLHIVGDRDETAHLATGMMRHWREGRAALVRYKGRHLIPSDAANVGRIAAAVGVMMRGV